MEILVAVIALPMMILVLGLLGASFFDVVGGGDFSAAWLYVFIILVLVLYSSWKKSETYEAAARGGMLAQLDVTRRFMVAISMAGLLPLFTRYLVEVMDKSLVSIIIALVMGFGFAGWGLLTLDRKLFSYSNLIGGFFILIYAYSQLWVLGELARIVATAFGLTIAVIVSVIKLKDRLT